MIQTIIFMADDFKDAQYTSNYDCPMARALKRYYPEAKQIVVGEPHAGISLNGHINILNIDAFNLQNDSEVDMIVTFRNYPIINGVEFEDFWCYTTVAHIKEVYNNNPEAMVTMDVLVDKREEWEVDNVTS